MDTDTQQNEAGTRNDGLTHTAAVSLSIIAAGALVAAAIFFGDRNGATAIAPEPSGPAQGVAAAAERALENMRPITADDHIRGNPDAPIKIVEYSDMECPFCKRFHATLKQAMEEYGKAGTLAWIYRHFPLDALHSKARGEAVAVECAHALGGASAFWAYLDRFFELTPANNQTEVETVLPQIAREVGLEKNAFASCLASGTYDAHIQSDLDDAIATGGTGTPWSIIVTASGKKYPVSGGLPYTTIKQLIELALSEETPQP